MRLEFYLSVRHVDEGGSSEPDTRRGAAAANGRHSSGQVREAGLRLLRAHYSLHVLERGAAVTVHLLQRTTGHGPQGITHRLHHLSHMHPPRRLHVQTAYYLQPRRRGSNQKVSTVTMRDEEKCSIFKEPI